VIDVDGLSLLTLVVRIGLAAIFGIAAVGKLVDRRGTREAAVALGAPRWTARGLAITMPVAEIALAVGLIIPTTTKAAAVGAFVLLLALSAVIVANLAADRHPACHCFGASDHEIGWTSVVRNLVIAAMAALVLWRATLPGRRCAIGCVSDVTGGQWWASAAVVVLAGVIGAHTWLLVNLVRQNGRLAERIVQLEHGRPPRPATSVSGLAPGRVAPEFTLGRVDGSTTGLGEALGRGRAAILLFVEPACEACVELSRSLIGRATGHADAVRLIVIARGIAAHVDSVFTATETIDVLIDPHGHVHAAYAVAGTPSAVLVTSAGRIASRTAQGRRAVDELLDRHLPAVVPSTTSALTASAVATGAGGG